MKPSFNHLISLPGTKGPGLSVARSNNYKARGYRSRELGHSDNQERHPLDISSEDMKELQWVREYYWPTMYKDVADFVRFCT